MGLRNLGDRAMPIMIKLFACIVATVLIYEGAVNIAEAGGFVTPIYSNDNGLSSSDNPLTAGVGSSVIPKDLLGELYLIAAGFVLINAKMNLNRIKQNKQVKEEVKALKATVQELTDEITNIKNRIKHKTGGLEVGLNVDDAALSSI